MSLGIVWKGYRCAAFAADSRQICYEAQNGHLTPIGHTDDARLLLAAPAPNHFAGVLTSHVGTIGNVDVSDLFDDFARKSLSSSRLTVAAYAQSLFAFYDAACSSLARPHDAVLYTKFLVAGFDPGLDDVVMYDLKVPGTNGPVTVRGDRACHAIGEDQLVDALIGNHNPQAFGVVAGMLGIPVAALESARSQARSILGLLVGQPIRSGNCAAIVDCLMSHAIKLERVAAPQVSRCGGPIDLAIITHDAGFEKIREKD